MDDRTRALVALDRAQRSARLCEVCGRQTVPVARGRGLLLECPALQAERSFWRRLVGHTRLVILDDAA